MQVQSNFSQPNFGKSIPVYYFAKDKTGKLFRVMKPDNIKKCHQYIIRNLTGSAKNKNTELIKQFSSENTEFAQSGVIRSVYEKAKSVIYLVTGFCDTEKIKRLAMPLGKLKSESIRRTGSSKSFEVNEASQNYFSEALKYLKQLSVRKKTPKGEPMAMRAFFNAEYKKDGSLKGFSFSSMDFVKENEVFALQ